MLAVEDHMYYVLVLFLFLYILAIQFGCMEKKDMNLFFLLFNQRRSYDGGLKKEQTVSTLIFLLSFVRVDRQSS